MGLLELLEDAGYVLDTPGALTRGLLAGRPGERASGREMLESWGLLSPNEDGLDAGDVLGFGADMLVDPLNLIGGNAIAKLLGKAGVIRKANKASMALREAGAMPEEIARLTKAVDESGKPMRMYHLTASPEFGPREFKPDPGSGNWLGKGTYFSQTPLSGYQDQYSKFSKEGSIVKGADVDRFVSELDKSKRPLGLSEPSLWDVARDNTRQTVTDPSFLDDIAEREDLIPESIDEGLRAAQDFANAVEDGLEMPVSMSSRNDISAIEEALLDIAKKDGSAPRTMMTYVDAKNTFDFDKPVGFRDIRKLIASPTFGFKESERPSAGKEVMKWLRKMQVGAENPRYATKGQLWAALQELGFSPDIISDAIRDAGYDSISHGFGTFDELADSYSKIDRSLAWPPKIDRHPEFVAFDPSQIYAPYIAPALQQSPRVNPLIAALLGYNVAKTPYQMAQ